MVTLINCLTLYHVYKSNNTFNDIKPVNDRLVFK